MKKRHILIIILLLIIVSLITADIVFWIQLNKEINLNWPSFKKEEITEGYIFYDIPGADLPVFVKKEQTLEDPPNYVSNQLIVEFKPEASESSIANFLKEHNLLEIEKSEYGGFITLMIPEDKKVSELIAEIQGNPLIDYVEPNYYFYGHLWPNDPLYGLQWNFIYAINMEPAWDITLGSSSVVVAVLDTGVAYEDNNSDISYWHITNNKSFKGRSSWWVGDIYLDDVHKKYSYVKKPPGYGNCWLDYLQRYLDLSQATGKITLSFMSYYDLQFRHDFVGIDVSEDKGIHWDFLKPISGKSKSWKKISIDLTPYKGKNILLRFRLFTDKFGSDEDGKYDSDGAAFIDEIKIEDDSGVIFYDGAEQGIGNWETTKYKKAPDLEDVSFVQGYDFVNNDSHPNDDYGHGTFVAGVIAQDTNNMLGATGISPKVSIMPIKVLDACMTGLSKDIADGIYFAVNNGAEIINMSLGTENLGADRYPVILKKAVEYAYNNNVTVIASCGNNGKDRCMWPAAMNKYVIGVGATENDESKAPYSNYGFGIDLTAPGGNISNLFKEGIVQQTFSVSPSDFGYRFYEGTSISAPHVSGLAALLLSKNPKLNPNQIKYILQSSSKDLGAEGFDDNYGCGLIDAYSALKYGLEEVKKMPRNFDLTKQQCSESKCGNERIEKENNEECDLGNANSNKPNAFCRPDCKKQRCGDGVIDDKKGEECDEGNLNSDQPNAFCRSNCLLPVCGDGILDNFFGEQCDNGLNNSNSIADACRTNCQNAYCGDNVKDTNEECDNGSNNSNQPNASCRQDCKKQKCGDFIIDDYFGEECDNGEFNNSDTLANACRTNCKIPKCGDGITDNWYYEECDDGNNTDGDGCSSSCRKEIPEISGCENECPMDGLDICADSTHIKTCSNYDDDTCLEWSPPWECGPGLHCIGSQWGTGSEEEWRQTGAYGICVPL